MKWGLVMTDSEDAAERKRVAEERERLLAAVDAQRQLFQAVVEHAPAGIAVYDGETFRIKWANHT
jgi:PAS domain-containing protein